MFSNNKKYKVLHLASWYPNRVVPLEGIFVQKHVNSTLKTSSEAVLYITFDPNLITVPYIVEATYEESVYVVRVYIRKTIKKIHLISKIGTLLRYIRGWYEGWKLIKKEFGKPDIINVDVAGRIGIIALLYHWLYNIPYVVIEHSTQYVEFVDRQEYLRHISTANYVLNYLVFYYSQCIITVSQYLARGIERIYPIQKKMFVVPNVVSIPAKLPDRLCNDEKIKILTISNLKIEHKRIDKLISAFHVVSKVDDRVELHIVGDGPDREALYALTNRYGMMGKSVFFHGAQPNEALASFFSQSNFFILNSQYETFSVVTAETLAHGVPALVTRCGGPEEFLLKEFGIIFDKNDDHALIEGIKYMIVNWKNFDSKTMYQYAKDHFSSEIVGASLNNIFLSTISKR